MPLPIVRLAYLHRFATSTKLFDWLLGTTLYLPSDLSNAEREDICDLVATFIRRPLKYSPFSYALPEGHLCIVTEPVDGEPEPVKDGVVIAVAMVKAGRKRLGIPNELRRLRDTVLQLVDQHAPNAKERDMGAWAQIVADSPSLAVRFVSATRRRLLSQPFTEDADLAAVGLAETLAWLAHGVDSRIVEWVVARALRPADARSLLSTDASMLDERLALQRALAAGLVEKLPAHDHDELDLRRPFALLGELDEIVPGLTLGQVRSELGLLVNAPVLAVLDRFLNRRPPSMRLEGPHPPRFFVGRGKELDEVCRLFEPAREMPMVVVHGPAGIGKTALASMVCQRLKSRFEPVWLTFVSGPEMAWRRVADVLGVEQRQGWEKRTFRALAERHVLLIVEDVDGLSESDLSQWLPGGAGSTCILVLSRQAQLVLQNEHDAIPVPLGPLDDASARALLIDKLPGRKEDLQHPDADGFIARLGGSPLAIGVVSNLLEKQSIAELMVLLQEGPEPAEVLTRGILKALEGQTRQVMEALAVSAPTGAPWDLLGRMVGEGDLKQVVGQLAADGLVNEGQRVVRLHGTVQIAVHHEMGASRRQEVERKHATAVVALMETADEGHDETLRDETYPNVIVALRSMVLQVRPDDIDAANVTCDLALEVQKYPRGSANTDLSLAIAGYRATLRVLTPETQPTAWARVQLNLGRGLKDLSTGNRNENLLQSIAAFDAALTVFTRDAFPDDWANVQNGLGNGYVRLLEKRFDDTQNQSIAAFEAALTVWTRKNAPTPWALVQNNLGNVYSVSGDGSATDNHARALQAYENALAVFQRDREPANWAMVQHNLGLLWAKFRAGNRPKNLPRALAHFQNALEVYTRQTYPWDWADTQRSLGSTLRERRGKKYKAQAIAAYRAALTVLTKDERPLEWAATQWMLGETLVELGGTGEARRNTLHEAMEAFRAALLVFTQENHLATHRRILQQIDEALTEIARS